MRIGLWGLFDKQEIYGYSIDLFGLKLYLEYISQIFGLKILEAINQETELILKKWLFNVC